MSPRARAKRAPVTPHTSEEIELANLDAHMAAPSMTPTEERREREIEEIIDELGSDGRIKVWHVIDGRTTYAGDMSASEFTLDTLMDAFGGGDKSLTLMQGKTKIDTFRVALDPSVPPKSPRTAKAVIAAANPATDMSTMMAMMMKSSLDSSQAISNMMTGIVGALTAVMTATKPTHDPMDVALKMAEVMKRGGGDGASTSEAMAMFREGLALAERFGDKDDGDGTMAVVSKGMDTLAVLVEGIVSAQKSKQVAVIPAPSADIPPGDVPLPDNGAIPPVSVRPWVDAARPHIGALLKASAFLAPPSAAEAVSNMLSDDQFNDLIDDIQDQNDGGFGKRLTEYFPREVDGINPEWIGQVIQTLLTEYVEEDPTP